ncbi:hypothetical protein DFR86_10085 [Acidianus sulfidivorans JP7]|uniref:Uncharacterized protein n=1 Tax=Acidianus sulfidivorans JP7 TaxID=619593 RepID=A0A2U9IPC0_9CREN|nr:hypothetical protein [Acidianus sulfidivorans]AWR97853.1 hypothetical protein DFR86_10085 [Acidianus sulfidivorans JP7]
MFNELANVVNYLNEGKIIEAGKHLIDIAKNATEEDTVKIVSEIEKEIREIDEEKWLLSLDTKFKNELISVIADNIKCKEEKIRALSLILLDKISKGNNIILNMLKNPLIENKPHTYI